MSGESGTPYNGTVDAETTPDINSPTKEFYRLPLKTCNEITIHVKASNDASILLFDGSKSSDASDIKVEVLLGGDKNSSASIGLSKDDSGKYGKELIAKDHVLSATHFKTFTVRWYKGRVMVYNHGFKKPFITWNGPAETQISSIGVRTLGCSGEWILQGAPSFTTADSKEYKETVINSGRMDVEICGIRDVYLLLTPEAKWSRNPIVHVIWGGWSTMRCGIWWNYNEVAHVDEAKVTLKQNEYRRFWIKWDAHNIWVGRSGDDEPLMMEYRTPTTPLPQLNYFSLEVATNLAPWALFHILDQVKPEDTATAPARGQPQQQQAGGGSAEVGYLVYHYECLE